MNKNNFLLLAAASVAAVFGAKKMIPKTYAQVMPNVLLPRGIRNNNPLNIEFNKANNWVGQTGSDGRYAVFSDSKYGIRAAAVLIKNYMLIHGLKTINSIVTRWAPSHENPTNNYIDYVSSKAGINKNAVISLAQIPQILTAMINFENGTQPYSESEIFEGCKMAGVL